MKCVEETYLTRAYRPEGVGRCPQEGGNRSLPNLQPGPHFLVPNNRSRYVADHDSPMLGHSSTQIVPRYAQALDQNRFDAMKKLESLRQSAILNGAGSIAPQSGEQIGETPDRTKST
jgi:hypothetical protein